MNGRRLRIGIGALAVTMLVTVVGAAPANADAYCWLEGGTHAIKAAATGKYISSQPGNNGLLKADGTVHGWYQDFNFCNSWDAGHVALKASWNGKFASRDGNGVVWARGARGDSAAEHFQHIWLFDNYWAFLHVPSGRYLSVNLSNGNIRADSTFVGWNQAFQVSGW